MIRLGLCCLFHQQNIKFRTTTVSAMTRMLKKDAMLKISDICRHNAKSLEKAILFCSEKGIGCFRISSRILPVKTHPEAGYDLKNLPEGTTIIDKFIKCGKLASEKNIRLTFHPDQFIFLNALDPEITRKSVLDLEYHAEMAEMIGADVINIHGGGGYGNKKAALERLEKGIQNLPESIRKKLALENDGKVFTPSDLFEICHNTEIPLVYDAHHHKCNPDGLSIADATAKAIHTWNREPLFHISSPKEGWSGPKPSRHHDYIDPADFPDEWKNLDITVEIEAKAKEVAVLLLKEKLGI